MESSYRYFENKECQYYPCHADIDHINCLFCYCPLYTQENCPGTYQYLDINGKKVKECTLCTFPHQAENYDIIIQLLSP